MQSYWEHFKANLFFESSPKEPGWSKQTVASIMGRFQCRGCQREFKTSNGLQKHLGSAGGHNCNQACPRRGGQKQSGSANEKQRTEPPKTAADVSAGVSHHPKEVDTPLDNHADDFVDSGSPSDLGFNDWDTGNQEEDEAINPDESNFATDSSPGLSDQMNKFADHLHMQRKDSGELEPRTG